MLLKENFFFIDIQTTGTNADTAEIVEASWYHGPIGSMFNPNKIKHVIVKTKEPISPRLRKIIGIKDEELNQAKSRQYLMKALKSDLTDAQVGVAHYARFEQLFLDNLFRRSKSRGFPINLLCSFKLAQRTHPELPSYGIKPLAGYFGSTLESEKRSTPHLNATILIWSEILKNLEMKGVATLDALRALTSEPPPKRKPYRLDHHINREFRLALPDDPGVYIFEGPKKQILYVGKATSLHSRVNSYFRGRKGKQSKIKELLTVAKSLRFETTGSPFEAAIRENDLIKLHQPPFNHSLRNISKCPGWVSRDFSKFFTLRPKKQTCYGPLSDQSCFDEFTKLYQAVKTKTYIAPDFLKNSTEEVLKEGFEQFVELLKKYFPKIRHMSRRSLIALGVNKIRFDRKQKIEEVERGSLEESGEKSSFEDDETEVLIDADFICSYCCGIVKSFAFEYLRAKRLEALTTAIIVYEFKGDLRFLRTSQGHLVGSGFLRNIEDRPDDKSSLRKLDSIIFDRLRIIDTEIKTRQWLGKKIGIFKSLSAPISEYLSL